MEIAAIIAIICIFLCVYPYAGYPVLLFFLTSVRRGAIRKSSLEGVSIQPFITLIISAYNEEDIIAEKIENSLALDHPRHKMEIIVVSDNSSDRTDAIVHSYAEKGVVLLSHPIRRGKTAGLNDAVARAKGEIVVFSDADAMYEAGTIKKILGILNDQHVGLVTGSTKYVAYKDGRMVETSSIYTRLERWIKGRESLMGSCVGADGAIFAMKRNLYIPLQHDDINDFVIPLLVVRQGYRVVLHEDIYCSEASSADAKNEFKRQTRITNRTLKAMFRYADLMNILKHPLFAFELISHKLIRFCVPFFLLLFFPLSAVLMFESTMYRVFFLSQIVFYSMAGTGYLLERHEKHLQAFGIVYHFVVVQASFFMGWIKYLRGENQATWNVSK